MSTTANEIKIYQKRLKVMQAFEDGKKLQTLYKHNTDPWCGVIGPSWDWDNYDYRIKPEPKVIYVNEYNCHLADSAYSIREKAIKNAGAGAERKAVKYIEVID